MTPEPDEHEIGRRLQSGLPDAGLATRSSQQVLGAVQHRRAVRRRRRIALTTSPIVVVVLVVGLVVVFTGNGNGTEVHTVRPAVTEPEPSAPHPTDGVGAPGIPSSTAAVPSASTSSTTTSLAPSTTAPHTQAPTATTTSTSTWVAPTTTRPTNSCSAGAPAWLYDGSAQPAGYLPIASAAPEMTVCAYGFGRDTVAVGRPGSSLTGQIVSALNAAPPMQPTGPAPGDTAVYSCPAESGAYVIYVHDGAHLDTLAVDPRGCFPRVQAGSQRYVDSADLNQLLQQAVG